MSIPNKIKIPFSYFGGKGRVSSIIWKGLGNVSNYVEPFCGSMAVLLANPNPSKIETVNDIDHHLANWWRAVSSDPDGVSQFCDYPVSEVDLHARHIWLLEQTTDDFKNKMESDPDFFDVKMAGFFVYGKACSIGNNFLLPKGLKALPLLSSAGSGIQGLTYNIKEDFKILQNRLRRVRIACGDWSRVLTPSITYASKGLGNKDITGIFLDPPYSIKDRDKVYKNDNDVYKEVCDWALSNGDNPRMRVVLCGYDGDYEFPESWTKYNWISTGMVALGNNRGKDNASKECIYFSPYCLKENL